MLVLIVVTIFSQSATNLSETPDPDITERTPGPTQEKIEVARISIVLDSDVVIKGSRFRPEIIIHPADATDKFFEVHTDDESVLRQQGNFWVALEIGTANIIATAPNGITAMVTVTVTEPPLESMAFIDDEIAMILGDDLQLSLKFTPEDAVPGETIIYTSSNENVVTVTEGGRITAVGNGSATIRATAGEIRANLRVNVIVPVRNITVTMPRRDYSVGDQAEFSITVEPENATNQSVDVSFSGASVTSTGENTFKCNEAGEVTITFTAATGTAARVVITVHDLAALAEEVHRLTNIERSNAGLSNLGRNQPLTQTALVRAREIMTLFSHTRPDGRDCFTAFVENNVQYRQAGENLAAGQRTAAEAVRSWMESPGHRENIVKADFANMGVGVTMDDEGRIYWTQTFTD